LEVLVNFAKDYGQKAKCVKDPTSIRFKGKKWIEFERSLINLIWVVSAFISFGIIANFIDNYGVLYNLGQGFFISLFSGGCLYFYVKLKDRRGKTPSVSVDSSRESFR